MHEIYDFSLNHSWSMLPTLSLCMYNIILANFLLCFYSKFGSQSSLGSEFDMGDDVFQGNCAEHKQIYK